MSLISLYPLQGGSRGAVFTATGLGQLSAQLYASAQISDLGAADDRVDLVVRIGESADRRHVRMLAYRPAPSDGSDRFADEWQDQLSYYGSDGALEQIQRDVITGELTVDDTFQSPTGVAQSFRRYQGLSADGASLEAAFVVTDLASSTADLLASRDSSLHLFITAGDDTVYGSPLDDQISAGAGVNYLFGHEGADAFILGSGRGGSWSALRSSERGLLLSRRKGDRRKRFFYDPDVDIVRDYQPGVDKLYLAGRPASYSFVDSSDGTLVFSAKSQRNLVAVIQGASGLSAGDFLSF